MYKSTTHLYTSDKDLSVVYACSSIDGRKVTHYGPLLLDLECSGLLVNLATIKVGCIGHCIEYFICINLLLDLYSNKQLELPFHAPIGYSMPRFVGC